MLTKYSPKQFRFFQTIYPPEYMFHTELSKSKLEKVKNKIIKTYLEQPENGKWINLNYKKLNYTASKEIDFDWIQLQMNYASTLSKRDILTASSYSFRGDRLINYYKRNEIEPEKFKENFIENEYFSWNSSLFPFFPQFVDILSDNDIIIDKNEYTYKNYRNLIKYGKDISLEVWYKIFDMFLIDFRKIIDNSPALINDITTWRGMNMDFMYNYRNTNKTNLYENTQFLSTSFDFKTAKSFTGTNFIYDKKGNELNCCFLNIKIPAGSHILLLMSYSKYLQEYEVLLKDQHLFKIIKNTNTNLTSAVTNMEIIKDRPKGKNIEEINLDFDPDIESYFEEAGFTLFGSTLSDIEYLKSL